MFNKLKEILSKNRKTTSDATNSQEKLRVAASILLLEAAHADDDCSEAEFAHVAKTLKSFFALDGDYAKEILELASHHREHAVDLWQFSNQINQEFSHQEKLKLMEIVWQIVFIDGHLDAHEDHFAHKLANLLRLTHQELIDAKLSVKRSGGDN